MSNKTTHLNAQPILVYQIATDDLEQLVTNAVTAAMERYSSSNTQVAESSSEMLTRSEAAKYLHVSVQTLANWEKVGYLTPTRAGRRVLYPVELLRQFTNSVNK
jgi:DNA-binding transcriptional regulator YiaG